jgi:hypothetical protein
MSDTSRYNILASHSPVILTSRMVGLLIGLALLCILIGICQRNKEVLIG